MSISSWARSMRLTILYNTRKNIVLLGKSKWTYCYLFQRWTWTFRFNPYKVSSFFVVYVKLLYNLQHIFLITYSVGDLCILWWGQLSEQVKRIDINVFRIQINVTRMLYLKALLSFKFPGKWHNKICKDKKFLSCKWLIFD